MAHTLDSSPHHRALKIAAPVFAGLLLLGACSKKEDPPAATSSGGATTTTKAGGNSGSGGTAGTGSDTTTKGSGSGTTEAPSGDTIKTDKTTFWANGFKVTLPDGKYDAAKETLTFTDAVIENLGPDGNLYGTYSLEADGTIAYNGGWKDTPTVIAKSKAKDTLVFSNVDAKFDPSKTTLVVGGGDEAQVRIPLGGDGEAVLHAPVIQEFKGKLTIGQIDVDVTQTEVRWDRPDTHAQAEKEKAFLVITGKVKNNSAGTLYWNGDQAILTRPDDTKTGATHVLGDGSVQTTQIDDKWGIIWEINEPVKGDYSVEFTQNFGAEGADVTVKQDLSITDKASGSGTTGTTKK
jgi:hypothetical protein